VSEIFDGAQPHTPRGAPSQAWSVACTLEAWWRLEKAKQILNRQDAKKNTDSSRTAPDPRIDAQAA